MINRRIIITAGIILGLALIAFLWFSPGVFSVRDVALPSQTQTQQPESASRAKDTSFKRLDIKSVIITLKSTAPFMGSDIEMRVYIDDNGGKYATVTDTRLSYNGQQIVTTEISIVSAGYTYSYDPDKKTGIKSINTNNFNPSKIDFSNLDKDEMQTYGLTKTGTETILGRVCDVYILNNPAMDIEGKYDVWKNIALRTKTHYNNVTIEMVAVKIQENTDIPARIFQIPKDVDFTFAQARPDSSVTK